MSNNALTWLPSTSTSVVSTGPIASLPDAGVTVRIVTAASPRAVSTSASLNCCLRVATFSPFSVSSVLGLP